MVVFLPDIFGVTPAFRTFVAQFPGSSYVDPYAGLDNSFRDEATAYQHFSECGGIDAYFAQAKQSLKRFDGITCQLVGFSAGASVAWLMAARALELKISKVACFYGGQIRHATDSKPQCPVWALMAKHESHFDVNALSNELTIYANVDLESSDYLHGFMNEYSTNFDENGYRAYSQKLALWLTDR